MDDERGVEPGDGSRLLWALAATCLAACVLLGIAAPRAGAGPLAPLAGASVPASDRRFVEIQPASGAPVTLALVPGTTVQGALALAGVAAEPPRDLAERGCESGDLLQAFPDGTVRVGSMAGARRLALGLRIPLNRAAPADLEAIPGVGPAAASRLIAARLRNGPFRSWDDVAAVPGIGETRLGILREAGEL
jgi:competence protein ComEA